MNELAYPLTGDVIAVRGGGDLATGVIQKFVRAGMRVAILETARPTAIRRTVALCQAVYDRKARVEDVTAVRMADVADCTAIWARGEVPLLVDPRAESLHALRPDGLIDAILAKRNLGTTAAMAAVVIALGPGFIAPEDAHAVIETKRGHKLGTIYWAGSALANTGIPGEIGGKGAERVLRAPADGVFVPMRKIGDIIAKGEAVFSIAEQVVRAPFDGVLRGLLQEGLDVTEGFKVADIDPRLDSDCFTISDKARCIGGGALEAYLCLRYRQGRSTRP